MKASIKEKLLEAPQSPGVYLFYDEDKTLLYVGKAKNLRRRLLCYKNATRKTSSKKVMRLIKAIREVEWKALASEEEALIHENRLLRTARPPFNRMNTKPDQYYVIGIRKVVGLIEVRLMSAATLEPKPNETLFGAFRGRWDTRLFLHALQRCLWYLAKREASSKWPTHLQSDKPSYRLLISYDTKSTFEDWLEQVETLLTGQSPKVIEHLETILSDVKIDSYTRHLLAKDVETLQDFFESRLKLNRSLNQFRSVKSHFVDAFDLDDLLVEYRFQNSVLLTS